MGKISKLGQFMSWAVLLTTATGTLMACQDSATSSPTREADQNVQVQIAASRAKMYHSLHELAVDSELVVRVVATNTQIVELVGPLTTSKSGVPYGGKTPFTVTSVQTRVALKGSATSGEVLKIRQIGAKDAVVEDGPNLLQPGRPYLLFLERFTYGHGQQTDQYVIVGGGAGLFADNGTSITRLDPMSQDLPPELPTSRLAAEL